MCSVLICCHLSAPKQNQKEWKLLELALSLPDLALQPFWVQIMTVYPDASHLLF